MATSEEPISLVMFVVQSLAWSLELPARGLLCCPQFLSKPHPGPRGHSLGPCCSSPRVDCLPAGVWLRLFSLGHSGLPPLPSPGRGGSAVWVADSSRLKYLYS
jgi:hypothetical protein